MNLMKLVKDRNHLFAGQTISELELHRSKNIDGALRLMEYVQHNLCASFARAIHPHVIFKAQEEPWRMTTNITAEVYVFSEGELQDLLKRAYFEGQINRG